MTTSVATEVSTRIKESDPKPDHCSSCFRGPQEGVRFFDFGAAFDAGAMIDKETQAYISGADDLHLCESCLKEGCEAAGYKPELHSRQLREIRRLELQRDHWRDAEGRQRRENEKLREYIGQLEADRPRVKR